MKHFIILGVLAFTLIVAINSLCFASIYGATDILFYAFVALLVCALAVSFFSIIVRFIPVKFFNFKNKIFKTYKWEPKFYEKLKIKKWKDRIPEMGKTAGFSKSKIENPKSRVYLEKFLQENCIASFIHICSTFTQGLLFLFLPVNLILPVGLPVFIVASYMNLTCFMVQRYLRPKLIVLYNRSVLIEQRNLAKLAKGENL